MPELTFFEPAIGMKQKSYWAATYDQSFSKWLHECISISAKTTSRQRSISWGFHLAFLRALSLALVHAIRFCGRNKSMFVWETPAAARRCSRSISKRNYRTYSARQMVVRFGNYYVTLLLDSIYRLVEQDFTPKIEWYMYLVSEIHFYICFHDSISQTA